MRSYISLVDSNSTVGFISLGKCCFRYPVVNYFGLSQVVSCESLTSHHIFHPFLTYRSSALKRQLSPTHCILNASCNHFSCYCVSYQMEDSVDPVATLLRRGVLVCVTGQDDTREKAHGAPFFKSAGALTTLSASGTVIPCELIDSGQRDSDQADLQRGSIRVVTSAALVWPFTKCVYWTHCTRLDYPRDLIIAEFSLVLASRLTLSYPARAEAAPT